MSPYPASLRAPHPAPSRETRGSQRVEVAYVYFALLLLAIKFRKDRDLDGAGRGEHFISMQKIFLPGGEIQDGHAKDALKIAVHAIDRCFQLLPQHLFFVLRSFFLRALLGKNRHWGPNDDGEQSKRNESFKHSDLRVSGIIRLNDIGQGKSRAHNFPQQQARLARTAEKRCDETVPDREPGVLRSGSGKPKRTTIE